MWARPEINFFVILIKAPQVLGAFWALGPAEKLSASARKSGIIAKKGSIISSAASENASLMADQTSVSLAFEGYFEPTTPTCVSSFFFFFFFSPSLLFPSVQESSSKDIDSFNDETFGDGAMGKASIFL